MSLFFDETANDSLEVFELSDASEADFRLFGNNSSTLSS